MFIVLGLIDILTSILRLSTPDTARWLCVPADIARLLTAPWTPFTYMFVQYDFWHLLFNLLWLCWFGRLLLTTLSGRHLLFLYIGGGLSGAFLYLIFFTLAPFGFSWGGYLCGASASILAIIVTSAIRTPDMRLSLFLIGSVKMKWVALVCILLTLLGGGGGNGGAQAAHIGGLLFGLAFALNLKKGRDLSKAFYIKREPNLKKERKTTIRKPEVNADAINMAFSGKLNDTNRLDELLDKIRTSGYGSLTSSEKTELNALSRKIN